MKRRVFLKMPLALLMASPVTAAKVPWTLRMLKGGFDGRYVWSGIAVTLEPNWKTYWRVPGDGGIAPQFEMSGQNLKTQILQYPMPHVFENEAGTTIGYKEAVVFPVALEPEVPSLPVTFHLKAFFGVCDEVCIPAQFEGELMFDPAKADSPDQALIQDWRKNVPALQAEGPVTKASIEGAGNDLRLQLELKEAVTAIFVEGQPTHYFGSPTLMRGLTTFRVSGAKTADELRGNKIRITLQLRYGTSGPLEQLVEVQ